LNSDLFYFFSFLRFFLFVFVSGRPVADFPLCAGNQAAASSSLDLRKQIFQVLVQGVENGRLQESIDAIKRRREQQAVSSFKTLFVF
jgi:hypothetical protein